MTPETITTAGQPAPDPARVKARIRGRRERPEGNVDWRGAAIRAEMEAWGLALEVERLRKELERPRLPEPFLAVYRLPIPLEEAGRLLQATEAAYPGCELADPGDEELLAAARPGSTEPAGEPTLKLAPREAA